jgi:hypothetical protein
MSLLWSRAHERFREDLQNGDAMIQRTKEALQVLDEIIDEKGEAFLRAWLHREGEFPLLFEFIKHHGRHVPHGHFHPDETVRLESILAEKLFRRLFAFSSITKESAHDFIERVGDRSLLNYFDE